MGLKWTASDVNEWESNNKELLTFTLTYTRLAREREREEERASLCTLALYTTRVFVNERYKF